MFQGEPLKLEISDAEATLAAAPHKVDVALHDAPSQPQLRSSCTPRPWPGMATTLRIHDASQAVEHVAWTMAQVFGIEEKQVHVTSPFVGGGFGSKTLVAAPDPGGGGGEAGGPAGAHRAVAAKACSASSAAAPSPSSAWRSARRPTAARRADPHRRGRDDAAQQHARAVHPAGQKGSDPDYIFDGPHPHDTITEYLGHRRGIYDDPPGRARSNERALPPCSAAPSPRTIPPPAANPPALPAPSLHFEGTAPHKLRRSRGIGSRTLRPSPYSPELHRTGRCAICIDQCCSSTGIGALASTVTSSRWAGPRIDA